MHGISIKASVHCNGTQVAYLLRMYVHSKVIYAHFQCRDPQTKEATTSGYKVLASLSMCDRGSAKLAWESASCSSTCYAARPDETPLIGLEPTTQSTNLMQVEQ